MKKLVGVALTACSLVWANNTLSWTDPRALNLPWTLVALRVLPAKPVPLLALVGTATLPDSDGFMFITLLDPATGRQKDCWISAVQSMENFDVLDAVVGESESATDETATVPTVFLTGWFVGDLTLDASEFLACELVGSCRLSSHAVQLPWWQSEGSLPGWDHFCKPAAVIGSLFCDRLQS